MNNAREQKIEDRKTQSSKARVLRFASLPALRRRLRSFCGHSYVTQPYGGGSRYHCPSCDVRQSSHGRTMVLWTNGRTLRRFCNN